MLLLFVVLIGVVGDSVLVFLCRCKVDVDFICYRSVKYVFVYTHMDARKTITADTTLKIKFSMSLALFLSLFFTQRERKREPSLPAIFLRHSA